MRARITATLGLGLLLAGTLLGCAETSTGHRASTPSPAAVGAATQRLPTASATESDDRSLTDAQGGTAEPDSTPTPTPVPGQTTIRVWWPDDIYPSDDTPAQSILTRQLQDFIQTYDLYDLQVRRKRATGLGGILPTLRTARPVAPVVLPDLTLMRRADMIAAAAEGLIMPLDDWIPPEIRDSLIPGIAELGVIDGALYGVPYLVTLYHAAFREAMHPAPLLTFSDVLEQQPTYLFPGSVAGQGPAANWTVLLQYLEAGGRLIDGGGLPVLDREALIAVYSYYELGVAEGIFSPDLMAFTQVEDYWERFETGAASLVFVSSATYLRRKESTPNTAPASIPTSSGTAISAPDAWMWVLTTSDPDRQPQARAFLSWMMRVSQQSAFSEAYGFLPTAQRALRLWEDQAYIVFAESLLANLVLIPDGQRANNAAAALQAGFIAVLDGAPAETAADEALGLLAG